MDRGGNIETDSFVFALLQYKNTPCRFLGQSPSSILFARKLKDGTPAAPGSLALRQEWIMTQERREKALAKNHLRNMEIWSRTSREKTVIATGQSVAVQSQQGRDKLKWNLRQSRK